MFNTEFDQAISEELIEEERFTLYMNEMLRVYIGSILIGLPLFYFIFQAQVSLNEANIWFTLDAILMVSVFVTYGLYYQCRDVFNLTTLKRINDISIFIFSINIATAPWLFLPVEADIYLYTMFIMIISLSGTVTHSVAYYFKELVVFSTLPLLSLAVKFHSMESDYFFEIHAALALVWGGLMAFAYGLNKTLTDGIILKFEHIQARSNAERINSEKSQFIAAASHDIRQPLQAISLFANTLKSRNENPEDDMLFQRLENSVDSMSELLNDLLDVSKLDAQVIVPQPKHLELDVLFNKLQGEFEFSIKQKNIGLTVTSNGCIVFSDAILLERVLNNLLSNAVRYTASGKIDLIAFSNAENITISITDTGMGIPLEEQAAIFMEFYQLNNPERNRSKGLGLGLPIVKRLCELQNWPLELISEEGKGSSFSISMPIGQRELICKVEKNDSVLSLQGLNVLVIDDDEDVRFSLLHLLENWGCQVHTFESSAEACESLNTIPLWRPHCIISDYRLAENKTGLEAVQEIRTLLAETVFSLIITGDTAPDKIQEIEASGLMAFHKPIKPAKLRSVIHHKMKHIINKGIS